MSAPGIKVDSRELERGLAELGKRVSEMPDVHAAVADSLLPGITQRTPVRTGALAASWSATGEPDRGVIESDEAYAGIVEAHAHMVADTIDASERAIVDGYEDGIAGAAARVGFGVKS